MKRTIWKYSIEEEVNEVFEIEMPVNAEILCCQLQHGVPCIWALVRPSDETTKRRFVWYETGKPINECQTLKNIATIQLIDGHYVVHLFEVLGGD